MNYFVMSRDLMRSQIEGHANEILLIRSFMTVELCKKNTKKSHINKTAKSKPTSTELKEKKFLL